VKIAVLTLTRDRLDYTRHCFDSLHEHAGAEFDHWVLDQGSADGTADWLDREADLAGLFTLPENIGISRGMNLLLEATKSYGYDVIVKIDNDCELVHTDTLSIVADLCLAGNAILSPRILGLNNPPAGDGEFDIEGETIVDIQQIGGIFLAAPASLYETFRYSEANPPWGTDDSQVCGWFRHLGGRCGYVKRLAAWHYQSTSGQHERFPEYFERTLAEGKPAL
jgi:glycosyltransferase involved in cell wall biosynthesis